MTVERKKKLQFAIMVSEKHVVNMNSLIRTHSVNHPKQKDWKAGKAAALKVIKESLAEIRTIDEGVTSND